METFAGFLEHTDAQIARVIDQLETLGIAENTLVIYITGDNGASAEGTVHGAWSAPSFQNGVPEDPEWLLEHMDDFGTAKCENHFNVGWAWALDSPFQWMKQVASHFGGTRNAMAISWPKKIAECGGLRTQFHHVTDIAPTIYEAAGIVPPFSVNGIKQMPIHGTSMLYSLNDETADSTHTEQYFEILGNRAMYSEGWIASCFHGRLPWIRLQGLEFDGPQEKWELYNIEKDFSQAVDLAQTHPDKLAELQQLFLRGVPIARPRFAATWRVCSTPLPRWFFVHDIHHCSRAHAGKLCHQSKKLLVPNHRFDRCADFEAPGCDCLSGRKHGWLVDVYQRTISANISLQLVWS